MTSHVNRADRTPRPVPQFSPGTGHAVDRPRPGHFKTRLVKNGPWVPALIYRPCPWVSPEIDIGPDEWCWPMDRYPPLEALINDRPVSIDQVWPYAQVINADEYDHMTADAAWQREHQPDGPKANPTVAVDLSRAPVLF